MREPRLHPRARTPIVRLSAGSTRTAICSQKYCCSCDEFMSCALSHAAIEGLASQHVYSTCARAGGRKRGVARADRFPPRAAHLVAPQEHPLVLEVPRHFHEEVAQHLVGQVLRGVQDVGAAGAGVGWGRGAGRGAVPPGGPRLSPAHDLGPVLISPRSGAPLSPPTPAPHQPMI